MWLVLSCWHPISIGSCIEPWNSLNEFQECIFEWRVRGSHIYGVAQKLQRQGTQRLCLQIQESHLWLEASPKGLEWKDRYCPFTSWFL